jgi:hypothetical protein
MREPLSRAWVASTLARSTTTFPRLSARLAWRSASQTMALSDWNWRLPVDLQDVPWDCAACSTAWCLRAIGLDYSESDVVSGLGPSRISPAYGLLDASGAGLVEYLGELGIASANTPLASWQDVQDAAGFQPMVIGGRTWNHWVAVRVGTQTLDIRSAEALALMNPSPGYLGVAQTLNPVQFGDLGDFSAVWITNW